MSFRRLIAQGLNFTRPHRQGQNRGFPLKNNQIRAGIVLLMSLRSGKWWGVREKFLHFGLTFSLVLPFSFAGFSLPIASALDAQLMTTAAVCTGAWGTGSSAFAGPATKIYAPRGATITGATIPYASASTKNTVRLSIYSNSGSLPGSLLGFLSFSSEASNVATLTGTAITLPTAGFYWVQIGATSSQMNCYTSSANYTGSNTGWLSYAGIAYGSGGSGYTTTSWAAFGSPQNAYQINFSLFGSELGSGTISLPILQTPATFRANQSITANTTGTGVATFYQNGRAITSCRKLSVSGSSVTCTWKPTLRGVIRVHSVFTPTGGNAIVSNPVQIVVNRRTTPR